MRLLVPTRKGLRAWILAAIQLVSEQFPIPDELASLVSNYHSAINKHMTATQRQILVSYTHQLIDSVHELDVKRWVTSVDIIADRIGFILANDLRLSAAVIEASPENAAAISGKERISHLLQYSVSEEYFMLRKKLGIALGD